AVGEAFKIAADLSPPRSPIRLRHAEFKLRTGAPTEAKSILEEITQKYPDYLPPRVYAMNIACAEHRDENCAGRVTNILAEDGTNYDAVFQDGLINLGKGDNSKAIREFEYLSDVYSRNPQVRYHLALAYLASLKDYHRPSEHREATEAAERAENRLGEAVMLDPSFEAAVLLLPRSKCAREAAAPLSTPSMSCSSGGPYRRRRPTSSRGLIWLNSSSSQRCGSIGR